MTSLESYLTVGVALSLIANAAIVGYLAIFREELAATVIECRDALARCEGSANGLLMAEQRAHDSAQEAKRFAFMAEGLHDCLKPPLPVLPADQASQLGLVDFTLPVELDPLGRTGEFKNTAEKAGGE